MEQKRGRIDLHTINFKTVLGETAVQETIEKAIAASSDLDRVARLAVGHCRLHHYLHTSRIGGAAITSRPCAQCGTVMTFSSTATDLICIRCSHDLEACRICGADLHGRTRRRKPLPPAYYEA